MQKITDAYKQQRPGAQQASRPGKQPGELPASQLHEGSGVGAPAPPAAAAVAAAPAATAERREDPSGADADEKALRQFDLDTRFGPCSGMSRLERWAGAGGRASPTSGAVQAGMHRAFVCTVRAARRPPP